MFTFSAIVDFCAIAPFYVAVGLDLQSEVRFGAALRVLRLVRILKIDKHNTALRTMSRVLYVGDCHAR